MLRNEDILETQVNGCKGEKRVESLEAFIDASKRHGTLIRSFILVLSRATRMIKSLVAIELIILPINIQKQKCMEKFESLPALRGVEKHPW